MWIITKNKEEKYKEFISEELSVKKSFQDSRGKTVYECAIVRQQL